MHKPLALAVLLSSHAALACTTFLDGDAVGKCYDWHMGQGLVIVNPPGVAKQALPMMPADQPARWRSEHASVTFNQYGREMPNGGMNDAGLVVEVMWLDETELPPPDARPTVNELQWIQYQLDRFATVDEMVRHAGELRVSRVSGRVHYFACDTTRACAAFEHVGGKLVVTAGRQLVASVLTNDTYARSAAALVARRGAPPSGSGSLDRFVRAADLVRRGAAPEAVLSSVRNDGSQWLIVYRPKELRVSFRTRREPREKTIDLRRLTPRCGAPVKMIDIDAPFAGDVTARLVDYSEAADRALVEKSLAGMGLPEGTPARLARYPEMLPCAP